MSSGGTVTIETGSLGSTENTGGANNFVKVPNFDKVAQLACYPNPATDAVFYSLNDTSHTVLVVNVFDVSGKLLMNESADNADILKLNVQHLAKGTYVSVVSDSQRTVIGSFQFVKQ